MKTLNTNNMKTFKLLQLFFIASILFSCTPDPVVSNTGNSFSIGADDYDTPHAYLFYGNNPSYRDGFMIALTDAPIIQDNVNGAGVATSMTHGAVLFVKHSSNYFPTEQQVSITNTTYTLDKSNTTVFSSITSFSDTFVNGGITYGDPDTDPANKHIIETTGSGTIIINAITIDFVARTGTIDCTYQVTADSGTVTTGNYVGTFEIRNAS